MSRPLARPVTMILRPVLSLRDMGALGQVWFTRHCTRKALARLDASDLNDIGLNRAAAATEARKPFWKA